jgi:menaquinone-dependent protoporphyrinogen oxidase
MGCSEGRALGTRGPRAFAAYGVAGGAVVKSAQHSFGIALSAPLSIFYASHDGHCRRIAQRIAARLSHSHLAAAAVDLATPVSSQTIAAARYIVLIAAIRYGHHLREAEAFLDAYGALAAKPPLALVSVNLTARKPAKCTPETNPYLRKWIKRRNLSPDLAAAFAGKLDYPRYRWFDRLAIQFIMTLTGGETDPTAVVEFTDWAAVDAFADTIAKRAV